MDNIRDGTTTVFALKWEVRKKIEGLKNIKCNVRFVGENYVSRVTRQIEDGEKFIAMLDESAYSSCKTVDELKQRISRKRNGLKKKLIELDPLTEGHQISIFEIIDTTTEEEKKAKEVAILALKEEIHWLHKCLGICKNKDYFN